MTRELHLGPYLGRDAGPRRRRRRRALQPDDAGRARRCVQLATAMEFLRDPDGYDAAGGVGPRVRRCRRRAGRAARGAGPGVRRRPADRTRARLELDAARRPRSRPTLDGPGLGRTPPPRLGRRAPRRPRACRRRSRPAARRRARRRGRAVGARPRRAGGGRAGRAAPDPAGHARSSAGPAATRPDRRARIPSRRCTTPSCVTYTWMGARADEHVVFGPRFAVYSAVVQLPDGAGRPSTCRRPLREDANVIDRLCRLALGTYEALAARRRTRRASP